MCHTQKHDQVDLWNVDSFIQHVYRHKDWHFSRTKLAKCRRCIKSVETRVQKPHLNAIRLQQRGDRVSVLDGSAEHHGARGRNTLEMLTQSRHDRLIAFRDE